MTPDEVMIQQRLAYEALSASTATRAPPTDTPTAPKEPSGAVERSKVTVGQGKKDKRVLSIREMVRPRCVTPHNTVSPGLTLGAR